MALPFFNGKPKKHDQVIAIDLGGRVTKAVLVQNQPEGGLTISRYAILDAPVQKSFAVDTLADHLKSIVSALDTKVKVVSLATSATDSIVRHAELPAMPVGDLRQILKINSKSYLQQDLPNHVFDCHILLAAGRSDDNKARAGGMPQKLKVLVAGAKRQFVDDLQTAVKNAGLIAEQIVPGLICPLNAFEHAVPEAFKKGTVAIVDLGFKNTTISLLHEGELALTRVVNIGGDRLTNGIVEAMGITYAEAEGIKVGMPAEIQPVLEGVLTPLGRELRASIDFFEHQQEKHVTEVYVTGGSSRSESIVKALETEMMIPCKTWNPLATMKLSLPPQQVAEIEQVAPQLASAVGAAASSF